MNIPAKVVIIIKPQLYNELSIPPPSPPHWKILATPLNLGE